MIKYVLRTVLKSNLATTWNLFLKLVAFQILPMALKGRETTQIGSFNIVLMRQQILVILNRCPWSSGLLTIRKKYAKSFFGCSEGMKGKDKANTILRAVEGIGLDMNLCRGQGAGNMTMLPTWQANALELLLGYASHILILLTLIVDRMC